MIGRVHLLACIAIFGALIGSVATSRPGYSQSRAGEPGACLTAEEADLARRINDFRAELDLPPIPLSKSLTTVARRHVIDLNEQQPYLATDARGQPCNGHSWSDQGEWTAVCYTPDHANAPGMWSKPREITGGLYPGNGYENVYSSSAGATAAGAIDSWRASPPHAAAILEEDIWARVDWQAMGVGIGGTYAVLWLGEEADPQGAVPVCPQPDTTGTTTNIIVGEEDAFWLHSTICAILDSFNQGDDRLRRGRSFFDCKP